MNTQHLGLAPNRHLTFPTKTRDQQTYGETPSRFDSAESDRLGRTLPAGSVGPMSAEEINDANHAFWARDDSAGMLRLAAEARGGAARLNTPYSLDGSDGRGSKGANCVNVKGPPGNMATSSDPAEAFANELNQVPPGQPNTAQNVLNRHYAAAKDGATRDGIEKIWRDFSCVYNARGRAAH